MEEIVNKVMVLLKENIELLDTCDLSKETQLISSGLLDSFQVISFLNLLEKQFGIEFDIADLDLTDFNTPLNIANAVKKRVC